MSIKLLGAFAVIGAAGATVPFFAAGHFTQQALNDQMQILTSSVPQGISIENTQANLGLYDSDFSYDVVFDLKALGLPEMAQYVGSDTVAITVNNKASHGFLTVAVDTTFEGQGKALVDKALSKLNLTLDEKAKPFMVMNSEVNVALNGGYSMQTKTHIQGFTMSITDNIGETATLRSTPISGITTFENGKVFSQSQIDTFTLSGGASAFTLDQVHFDANAEFSDPNAISFDNLIASRMSMTLEKVALKSPDMAFDALHGLNIKFDNRVVENRAKFNTLLKLEKAGHPAMAQTQVSEVELSLGVEGGLQAFKDYYRALEQLQGQSAANDPQQALIVFSKMLAEPLSFRFDTIKANTFAGKVDATAELNAAAVDPQSFRANPAVLVNALSYSAKGEIPKALLLMSDRLSIKTLENLLNNGMLTLKDQQVLFDMQGEKGHVNLNGKPLM